MYFDTSRTLLLDVCTRRKEEMSRFDDWIWMEPENKWILPFSIEHRLPHSNFYDFLSQTIQQIDVCVSIHSVLLRWCDLVT